MREIRRRTRVVGAFPDGQSCLNLAAARLRAGSAWSTKRYMNTQPLYPPQVNRSRRLIKWADATPAWIEANKANGEVQRYQLRRIQFDGLPRIKAVADASSSKSSVNLCLSMTYLKLHQNTKLGVFGTARGPKNQ